MIAAINPTHRLTPAETLLLPHLTEGAPNKLIARKLGITEHTVKVHVKSILHKLSLRNRTQAAIWYDRQQRIWE